MFCECGAELPESEKVCSDCGRPVSRRAAGEDTVFLNDLSDTCAGCGKQFLVRHLVAADGCSLCHACARQRERPASRHQPAIEQERRGERLRTEHLYARVSKAGVFASLLGESPAVGPTIDLSVTGMQCLTSLRLAAKDKVHVELRFPGDDTPLALEARVRWVREEGAERYRLGLEFEPVEFHVRQILEQFLDERMEEQFRMPVDVDAARPASVQLNVGPLGN